jgi:hypothetical protein
MVSLQILGRPERHDRELAMGESRIVGALLRLICGSERSAVHGATVFN